MTSERENPECKRTRGFQDGLRQRPTLPHSNPCSTIGAEGLDFRVRDGIGYGPFAIATGKNRILRRVEQDIGRSRPGGADHSMPRIAQTAGVSEKMRAKPHDPLVPVSSTHCCASTPGLSPRRLQGVFRGLRPGKSHLEAGFPLRCFQRLSLPHVATRRCRWRDNRNTSDASIPVLSY